MLRGYIYATRLFATVGLVVYDGMVVMAPPLVHYLRGKTSDEAVAALNRRGYTVFEYPDRGAGNG